jgi:hypothetical protein
VGVEVRRRLLPFFRDDVALLERVTGASYSDWLSDRGQGAFSTRSLDAAP